MRKLKNVEIVALFFLGLFLFNFFWSYYVSSSAIAATSNKFHHFNTNGILKGISIIGMLCSFLFSFSFTFIKLRPLLSFILYLLLVLAINFNIYIIQLHYAFICVCLIYVAFFYSENEKENFVTVFNHRFHSKHLILILFFSSFTISGISKFFFDGWTSGYLFRTIALREKYFLILPAFRNAPLIIFQILSFLIGGLEILCLPLYLYRKTRFIIWLSSLLLHVFIYIGMSNINNISIAMIIVHLFLYDSTLFEHSSKGIIEKQLQVLKK
jgi:hypothetical protein